MRRIHLWYPTLPQCQYCMADTAWIAQFLIALGELARGANGPSVQPLWAREILTARMPPRITHKHPEYDYTSEKYTPEPDSLVHRSFFFGHNELSVLKEKVLLETRSVATKFELIVTCLWRCRTIAVGYGPEEGVRLMCVVEARGKHDVEFPKGFCGMALAFPVSETDAGELCTRELSYAVRLVKEHKARAISHGYMQSVADLLASKGRPHFAYDRRTFMVSDLSHPSLEGVDFGWGKAAYAGPATASIASYCVGARNGKGEEGIRVAMHLPELDMRRFCLEMERVFRVDSNVYAPSFEWGLMSRL